MQAGANKATRACQLLAQLVTNYGALALSGRITLLSKGLIQTLWKCSYSGIRLAPSR